MQLSYRAIYLRNIFSILLSFAFASTCFAQGGEVGLLNNINPDNPSSKFWQVTSASVYPISVGIPAGLLVLGYLRQDKNEQRKGWEIVGALAVNTVIAQGMKYAINRNRPYTKYPDIIHPYDASEEGKSFPSGHTSTAFALATSLSIEYKKWYVVVPAYAYAASVGYSRLYLGEHYPTDVLAGAAIGAGSAYLSHWLEKKIFKNK
ncbi:phosphatase PAP2 family protein [Parasediminibacterium sp. JCM 36343]|uniref:phosphatase PAP2 family protein n=1 Tax=Parasediminibacterium sp. JCM 36343 TaxID=3374279 RepID=UPI0039788082